MMDPRPPDSRLPADAIRVGREEAWALLQSCVLFTAMPFTDCRAIAAMARECSFDAHQVIFAEGEPIREVLLLRSGSIKLAQFGNKAREVILGLCGPGEVVGAVGAAAGSHHTWSAQALEAGSAFTWDAETFDTALDRYPTMRRNIMRILSDRLCEIEQRFRELATEKVADRVAHELVRLLAHIGKPVKGAMEINLSREELAQVTGTTLFTVSRLLSDWQEEGIVTARRGGISVHDPDQLRNLKTPEES